MSNNEQKYNIAGDLITNMNAPELFNLRLRTVITEYCGSSLLERFVDEFLRIPKEGLFVWETPEHLMYQQLHLEEPCSYEEEKRSQKWLLVFLVDFATGIIL